MTQPIWYDSTEVGAPTLNNAAGSLLEVLRACLINGFNARTVTSIAVASGVATATAADHGFSAGFGKLVLIAGAPQAALNGRKQPSNVLTNSFTFPAPGVADGTYTGTISARRAPLGWVEAHTGANRAIFRRSIAEALSPMLRVLDTGVAPASGSAARAFAVETASDADTFTGQTPTQAVQAGGQFWQKSDANATAKRWHLVGDSRALFLFTQGSLVQNTFVPHFFGDIRSIRGTDAFSTLVAGNLFDQPISFGNSGIFYTTSGNSTFAASAALVRASDQLGASVLAQLRGGISNAVLGGSSYPTALNGGNDIMIQHDLLVAENTVANRYAVRGVVPGLCAPWAERPFISETVVSAVQQEVRSYLAIGLANQVENGMCLIDLTGPWY